MKTKSAHRLVRNGSRAAYLLAVSIAALLASGPSRADITLNGTPQSFSGTPSGTMTPGVNASYFDGFSGYDKLDLEGASYSTSTTRCFTGTQGILGLTPTTSVVNYTGSMSGLDMLGVTHDRFYTGWSGSFTPQGSGEVTYTFYWSNDDRGNMFIDKDGDGVFQASENIFRNDWHNEAGASVTLTAGSSYNFIYMTADGGGGYNNTWSISGPGLSQRSPQASDPAQAGMWNVGSISYGALDFTGQNLNVNADTALEFKTSTTPLAFALLNANDGTATISTIGGVNALTFTGTHVAAAKTSGVATGAALTLGPVTIGAGGTLVTTGSGTKTATSITLSGASGGITADGTFNLGTYSDGGSTKTLTLGGTGTKVMNNSAGGISAANTTLRTTGGTLDTTATAVGSNDPLGGATAIQLAGGKLKMQGQTTTIAGGLRAGLYYHNTWNPDQFFAFHQPSSILSETPSQTAIDTGLGNSNGQGINYNGNFQTLFPGMPGTDHFQVAWTGNFTAQTTGTHNFDCYWGDDIRTMYLDLNRDGSFTENERLSGNWGGQASVNLTAGLTYKVAFGFGDWEGGENVGFQFKGPGDADWKQINPASGGQSGMWSYSTISPMNLSAKTLRVDASSEINTVTDAAVAFGALTVNNGVLTLSGAPSTSFASTTVNAAATQIGFNSAAPVDAGTITGNSATATFVKAGVGTLKLAPLNSGLENMSFDVQAGNLTAPNPASLGGATSVQLSGGTLMLSSTGGDVAFDLASTVTQNSTLTVGKASGGADGPLTVTLGSAAKALTIQNGKTLTLTATDSYALNLNNSITLQDNAQMNVSGAGVNLNNSGATTLTMGNNSTINLNAGTLTTDKALDVYNLNLNGGLLTQTGTGAAKNLTVRGTLKVDNASTNLDLTGATLTTDPNATINLVNGTLTTATALTVGNLTVESGGTLNRTGTGANGNVTVGGKLRLNGESMNTTGSALSVGDRIELDNGASLTSGSTMTFNTLWMNNSTFTPGASTTINGSIEVYGGSKPDFTGKTLTTSQSGTNLYIRNNGTELIAGNELTLNYLEIQEGGELSVPSVRIQDRAYFRSTDGRYGNNTHSFNIAGNRPETYIQITGGGVDRNPNDGSADIYLTGTNTYTGETQIHDATVLVATQGVGLPTTSSLRFHNGVLGTNGTFSRVLGTDPGQVAFHSWGGFAAYGAPLTVSLGTVANGANAQLYWNSFEQGFINQGLYLGSSNATHNVTLTNNIEINAYAQIATYSRTTLATLSGNLTGTETLDKQGPGTLVLTGDNSGFSGRQYIRRGMLDAGLNGSKLGTGRVDLQADNADIYNGGAILQANGTLAKQIGSDPGNIWWEENGGGFAARGGNLAVTLNGGAMINWNDDPSGFRGKRLMFGSCTADSVVTLTNNLDAQNGYRYIHVYDNPNSTIDKAVLAGTLTDFRGFELSGNGVLEIPHDFTAIHDDQLRTYETSTLRVLGNLRVGIADTSGDPRYLPSGAFNNLELNSGNLYVSGDVQAHYFYSGGDTTSQVDILGNVALRHRWIHDRGTAHVVGNVTMGEEHFNVRDGGTMIIDGTARVGAPSGGAHPGADRNIYVESGATLTANGNVQAAYLQLNGSRNGIASSAHLNGATVSIGDNGSGNGNIHLNGENQTSGGVLDGDAEVFANYVEFHNMGRLAGTLVLNVSNKIEMHGSNSVIAPGNSAGTLTVNGNLQLNGGSHYEFDGGDLIVVNNGTTSGTLTAYDGWNLDLKAGGTQISAGGSMVLFAYQTLGDFDLTPNINVADLITAGWLPGGFDTATLSLTAADGVVTLNGLQAVSSGTPTYASWALEKGIAGQPANGDYDNDGVANAVEMVLGGDPKLVMDAGLMPTLALVTNPAGVPAGNYLEFTYRRTDLSVSASVAAACQYNTNLGLAWSTAKDGENGVKVFVDDNYYGSGSTATDRVRVYVPRGANTTLFGRLNVTVP